MAGGPASQPGKRKRVRRSITRTGCETCKRRHLKCDEEKPRCRRCRDAGWPCTDYVLRHSDISSQGLPASISAIVPGTDRERRSFQYFQSNVFEDLSGYFEAKFWRQNVLQRSCSEPAIRHALLAIAGLHEYRQPSTNPLTVTWYGKTPEHELFALTQYTRAIEVMRGYMAAAAKTGNKSDLTLICCLLFVCFETLRGRPDAAISHLQSGLNILDDRIKRGQSSQDTDNPAVDAPQALSLFRASEDQCLVDIFTRLDVQATTFLDTRYLTLVLDESALSEYRGRPFRTLHEARACSNILVNVSFRFLATYSIERRLPPDQRPAMVVDRQGEVLELLQWWNSTFQAFAQTHASSMNEKDLRAAVLLRLHHMVVSLMVRRAFESGVPDPQTTAEFGEIVRMASGAASKAKPGDEKAGNGLPSFSLDLGVIGPLYYAALNCADPNIQRRAIDLLAETPRREGLWDAALATKIASASIVYKELEQSGQPSTPSTLRGGVPDLAKALGVTDLLTETI